MTATNQENENKIYCQIHSMFRLNKYPSPPHHSQPRYTFRIQKTDFKLHLLFYRRISSRNQRNIKWLLENFANYKLDAFIILQLNASQNSLVKHSSREYKNAGKAIEWNRNTLTIQVKLQTIDDEQQRQKLILNMKCLNIDFSLHTHNHDVTHQQNKIIKKKQTNKM